MMLTSLLVAMALAAQAEPPAAPQPEMDSAPAPWSDSERELRKAGALDKGNDLAARQGLERWASCVARKNAPEAARLLTMDFKTAEYERGMRKLSQTDKECVGFRGTLKTAGLLFAGELAEALLESDSQPLVRRLARASAAPATPAFSFTDRVAICVVRSVPDDVAALFATARGSAEETARIDALATPMALCAQAAQARRPIEVNPAGLRAMLATAAYRSVAGSGGS